LDSGKSIECNLGGVHNTSHYYRDNKFIIKDVGHIEIIDDNGLYFLSIDRKFIDFWDNDFYYKIRDYSDNYNYRDEEFQNYNCVEKELPTSLFVVPEDRDLVF